MFLALGRKGEEGKRAQVSEVLRVSQGSWLRQVSQESQGFLVLVSQEACVAGFFGSEVSEVSQAVNRHATPENAGSDPAAARPGSWQALRGRVLGRVPAVGAGEGGSREETLMH